MGPLTPDQARRIYDRIGRWQDTQAFYERWAVGELVAHAGFDAATSVFEFGCGTGRLAAELLAHHLPDGCRYTGADISSTMVRLAAKRIRPWAERAAVRRTDGSARAPVTDGECSHFLSTYVLDLLSAELAAEVVAEAHRILAAGGRLCLVSTTDGATPLSRMLTGVWKRLWAASPGLVGGCRPIALLPLLASGRWVIEHHTISARWGISSEVVVARRRGGEPVSRP